MKHEEKY